MLGAAAIVALVAGLLSGWMSLAMMGTEYPAGETPWIAFLNGMFTWPEAPIQAVVSLLLSAALAWMAVSGRAMPRRT